MTSPETPVGACGDAAPTGDELIGYQRVQIDEAVRTITALLTAIDSDDPRELSRVASVAVHTLDYLKDRP